MSRSITLIEPVHGSYGHSVHNASVLGAVFDMGVNVDVTFFATKEHIREVQSVLNGCGRVDLVDSTKWEVLSNDSLKRQVGLYRGFVNTCSEQSVVLFLTCSNFGLAEIQHAIKNARGLVAAIIHQMFWLAQRASMRPWMWKYDLKSILRKWDHRCRGIVLSEPVYRNTLDELDGVNPGLQWMDNPRLAPMQTERASHDDIWNFGFIGTTGKGFSQFVDLARSIVPGNQRCRFSLAGGVNSKLPDDASKYVDEIPEKALSFEELEYRIGNLDAGIWTCDPRVYRLTCSGSFIDAIAHYKPVFAIQNEFAEHYFKERSAGKLFADLDTLGEYIESLTIQPKSKLLDMQEQARHLATRFAPSIVASQLHKILEI